MKKFVFRSILIFILINGLWGCSRVEFPQKYDLASSVEEPPLPEEQPVKHTALSQKSPVATASGIFSSGKTATSKYNEDMVYKIRTANHSRLLTARTEINKAILASRSSGNRVKPTEAQLQEWSLVLYEDALLTIALNGDLSDEDRDALLGQIESGSYKVDLDMLTTSNPYLSDTYLDRLRKVLNATDQDKNPSGDTILPAGLVLEIQDLLKRRKCYSDSYYKTEMKNYFRNDAVSLEDKVAYFEKILISGDTSLIRYGAGYFEYLKKEGSVDSHEMQTIDDLLEGVKK